MRDDDHLYAWLRSLQVYGLTIVENMPGETTALKSMVDRIGFFAPTHYGVDFAVLARSILA